MDGTKLVNNDYAQLVATERCSSAVPISAGLHVLYIEGWARLSTLSMSATYQGPDTSSLKSLIPSAQNPDPLPINISAFSECDPIESKVVDDGVFTICAFKADNDTDLTTVDDVYSYYGQVGLNCRVDFQWCARLI